MSKIVREKALIARLRHLAKAGKKPVGSAIRTGIGDDCAVLRLSGIGSKRRKAATETLVTTDFSLEGIHFRRDWHSPESVGHRCLARGLSDIAAMGGEPVAAFLSLALPRNVSQIWVERFLKGLLKLSEKHSVSLAGGDTSESPDGILADIVVIGTTPAGKAILRSGAKPGDRIYVTGELGGSASALQHLQEPALPKSPKRKINPRDYPCHFFPEPRLEVGSILREKNLASAMIDTSDGLSTDLTHICEESRVGAVIESTKIPRARVGQPARTVDLDLALHGGEDYELLFTAHPSKRIPSHIADIPITKIGHITHSKNILLIDSSENPRATRDEFRPQGWEHFRK